MDGTDVLTETGRKKAVFFSDSNCIINLIPIVLCLVIEHAK